GTGEPRRDLPAPHPGDRSPGRRGAAATWLVPPRLSDEPCPRTVHVQAAVLLRALPPRPVRALRLPRPDRDLPAVRVLHRPRPRDGRPVPRRGRGPRGPERAPRRGPVRWPPVLARRRRPRPSVRVRFLPHR